MGTKKIANNDVEFKTDISNDDKLAFNSILGGKEENGQRVLNLLKKFF